MPTWLLVQAELRFKENFRPVFPKDYRPNLVAEEESGTHYGMHFVAAPARIDPGDRVIVDLVFRPFPQDACAAFQRGTKVFLKDGPLTRAEGTIIRRWEHESPGNLNDLRQELAPGSFQ